MKRFGLKNVSLFIQKRVDCYFKLFKDVESFKWPIVIECCTVSILEASLGDGANHNNENKVLFLFDLPLFNNTTL